MSTHPNRILYTFKISHYAEKARWALDRKALPYREETVLIGPGQVLLKLRTGSRQVPVLDDGGHMVPGSTAILEHLDRRYPTAPLWPEDPAARAEVKSLVGWIDERIGKGVRGYLLAQARHNKRLGFGAKVAQVVGPAVLGVASDYFGYESLDRAQEEFPKDLRELAARLVGNDFLIGDRFGAADLTAASLLNALYAPVGSPLRSRFNSHRPGIAKDRELTPLFDWLDRMYRDHRRARPVADYGTPSSAT